MVGRFTDYQAVYKAWLMFRKGKNPSSAIDIFAYNLEQNIQKLSDDLCTKTYQHGVYNKVVVKEKKRRDLAVAGVNDRVVHRLLYDYLVNIFDKQFDPDVWSCRKGKGLHKCLARTQKLIRKHKLSFVWRADITKFFDNVFQEKLLDCLRRKLQPDDDTLWLCESVIDSYNMNRLGIPIGNLTSQIFANIYLNEFDRFVRHTLKPQAYERYGDDFLLFCRTRKQARELRLRAKIFLSSDLGLSLNPKNDIVVPAKTGLKFLGHDITRVSVTVDKHTTKRVIERLNSQNAASYKALYLDDNSK